MNDLIYNQNHIPLNEHRYGFRPSADVGCGWVATHNALRLMGYKTDIHQLIRYYEWQLPLIHGNAGTSFWGPALCFKQWGFPVKISVKRAEFDALARESDVCILFFRWHRKVKFGAHFVTVRKTDTGFRGYNTFKNSEGPDDWGDSIDGFLKKQKYYGAVLIGIRDKR